MTKAELAEKLAREHGSDILDDVLGIAEAMETYDLVGTWEEMEGLIRAALNPLKVVEEIQTDDARITVLADITMGRPYALIFMDPQEDTNKLVINVECGGGVSNRADLEEFLEAALRYLRDL